MADRTKLTPARKRLLDLIEQTDGVDMKSLSIRLGRNPAYLQQYIDRGTPRELNEHDRLQLSAWLGCDQSELIGEKGRRNAAGARNSLPSNPTGLISQVEARNVFSGQKDLPIYGHAAGGGTGFFIENGEVQGYTMRPAILQGVRNAYAVYVHDESMVPAFEPGHTVWVDPGRPVLPGADVIIQLTDGQAFIKRLVRRTQKAVICQQWNPRKEIKFTPENIAKIHLVVGSVRVSV